jgi:hypothetical protein
MSTALAHGSADRMLLAYSGWTAYVASHRADTMRIWGCLLPLTGVADRPSGTPESWHEMMVQTYPSPFAGSVTIGIQHQIACWGSVKVYNMAGQLLSVLEEGLFPGGQHSVTWEGRDGEGRPVASGIYFCQVQTAHCLATRRLILLR